MERNHYSRLGGLKMKNVITYCDSRGNSIDICMACEKQLTAIPNWPVNAYGEQLCTVSKGLHKGHCDLCDTPIDTEN